MRISGESNREIVIDRSRGYDKAIKASFIRGGGLYLAVERKPKSPTLEGQDHLNPLF
jgi:hypothetical protein